MMQRLGAFTSAAVEAVWPRCCMTCDARVEADGLCPACWREMPFIRGARCVLCGIGLPGASDGVLKCDDCLVIARPWDAGFAAVEYEGPGRKLVLGLKHGDRTDLAKGAADWMGKAGGIDAGTVVVPVPLHRLRLVRRRYNQAALLARHLARANGATLETSVLARPAATPPQDHKTRESRFENVRGAFAVRHLQRIEGRHVALVDDVMTSGATLTACADVLNAAGAGRITIHVLARVAKEGAAHISES